MATKGRIELIQWLNECTQCDYNKIQMCSDGVGYIQVLDAIHPGIIQLSKINFNPRFPQDFQKNLRLLSETLVKLRVKQVFPFEKMARGKFQDNMIFLQWLYSYARKIGPQQLSYYKGFLRRQQALQKQRKDLREMSPHLIPNQAFFPRQQQEQYEQEYMGYQDTEQQRLNQINEYIKDLQDDLKIRMQKNWKLMHNLDRVLEQRNNLNNMLNEVERIINKFQNSQVKEKILMILTEVPDDFKPQ